MILGIQEAYYLAACNPSDDKTLVQIAEGLGLDAERFSQLLNAVETQAQLDQEIEHSRSLGVHSFPSLVLQQGQGYWPVPVDYTNVDSILETIQWILD